MSQRCLSVGVALICLLCVAWPAKGERVTITGTVTGADGAPAAEAQVMTSYGPVPAEMAWPWAKTITDAAGGFTLTFECERARKSYAVVATKEGFALAWERVEPGGTVQIQLDTDPAACLGTVRDAEGKPIAGARVRVSGLSVEGEEKKHIGLSTCEPPVQAVSDAVGNFWIPGLPRGAEVWPVTLAEGYAYKWGPDKKPAKVGQAFTITLQPEATVSGRVTHHGKPVAGVRVMTLSEMDTANEDAVTAADGTYTARSLPAGTFRFTIAASDEWIARGVDGIDLPTGEHKTGVDIEVFKPAIIEGAVRLKDTGEPAVGAVIMAGQPASSSARTDAEGHYRLPVAPGKSLVQCLALVVSGYATPEPRHVTVRVEEGEAKSGVNFVLKPNPVFSGLVLGPDGLPLGGAEVWVLIPELPFPGAWPPPQQSDNQGRFRIGQTRYRGRAPWVIFARHAEQELAGLAVTEVADDDVMLSLGQGGYVTAQAAELDGKPAHGVRIRVHVCRKYHRPLPLPFDYTTDGEGQVTMGPLPAGCDLEASLHPGDARLVVDDAWEALREWSLEPGETWAFPTIRLMPGGRSVSGVVADRQGDPVAGATVIRQWSHREGTSRERASTTTDTQGRFTLTGLKAAGPVALAAVSLEPIGAVALECDPGPDTQLVLTLQDPGVAQGVVYDANGAPVRGVKVSLSPRGGGFPLDDNAAAVLKLWVSQATDDRGRWRFEHLVPGVTYTIGYSPPGDHVVYQGREFLAQGGETPVVVDIRLE